MKLGVKDFFDAEAIDNYFKTISDRIAEIDKSVASLGSRVGGTKLSDVKTGKSTANEAQKEAIKLEKDRIRIEKEAQKEVKKLADAEAKKEANLRKSIVTEKEANIALKATIRSEQQLIETTNLLVKRRKQLDITTKQGQKEWELLTKRIKENTDKLKSNDAQIGRFQRNVGNYAQAFKGLVGAFGMIGGGALFISTLSKSITLMKEFSKASSNLSAITGITGKQLQYLERSAIEAGSGVEGGATAVIESYKLIASANSDLAGNADALKEISKQAIVLSQASGTDLKSATEQLMQILNKMGVSATESGKSLDILAASAKWGTSEIPQVTDALLAMGGTMKLVAKDTNSANDNVREANSLIQVLAKNGKIGAEAGTGLRNVLLKLAAVDVLPKAAVKQLQDAGVNMNMLKDTTIPLSDRLKELSKISKNASALTKVFGVENIEVGKIILDNTALFDDYNIKLNENGVAADQAATNMNNLSGDLVKLSSTWDSLLLSLETGNGTTAKFLRSVVNGIREVLQLWQNAESGMFQGLEAAAVSGDRSKEIEKENKLFLDNIKASNKRRLSTQSDLEQKKTLLNLLYDQIKVDEITLKFDREKAELSSENKLNYAYQNGALAMRIKFLKEQSALVKLGIDEATKEQKTIGDNTGEIEKNGDGKEKATKKTINLYQTEKALKEAFKDSGKAAKESSDAILAAKFAEFNERQKIEELQQQIYLEGQKKLGMSIKEADRQLNEGKKQRAKEYLMFLLNTNKQASAEEILSVRLLIAQIDNELTKGVEQTKEKWSGASYIAKVFGITEEDSELILDNATALTEQLYDLLQQQIQNDIDAAAKREQAAEAASEATKQSIDDEIAKQNGLVKVGAAADANRLQSLKARLASEKAEQRKAEQERIALEKRAQSIAITKATIGTAVAVVNALQTQPFYVGLVLAAIAAAAGAAEIATISSAKYAEGTEYLDDAKAPQGTDTINIWADRGERIVPKGINSKIPRDVKNEDIPMLINYALMSEGLGGYGTLTIDNNKVDFSKAEYYLQGIYAEAKNKQAFDNDGRLKVKISNGNLIRYS